MAQEHQQEYSYRFQDSPLWHQPRDRSREMLFRALDAIEEPVIIVDRDTRVRIREQQLFEDLFRKSERRRGPAGGDHQL